MSRPTVKGLQAENARLVAHIATLEHQLAAANARLGTAKPRTPAVASAWSFKDATALSRELGAEMKRTLVVRPVATPKGIRHEVAL